MNRTLRTTLVVGIAVIVAGLASLGVYRAIQRVPVREVEVGRATMVIAAQAMPMGTRITRDNVKGVRWPTTTRIEGRFAHVDGVLERGLVADVVANEPITESKLAPLEAGAGLPPAIPKGMRAISVKVNEAIGVAGFVVPGTRVDVLARVLDEKNSMSRIVLSDVQVLTAGTRYDQDKAKKDGKPIPSTVVTLMVTPQDAERVALVTEKAKLMLALRNPLDQERTQTAGARLTGLMAGPAAEPKPATPRRVAAAPPPEPPAP